MNKRLLLVTGAIVVLAIFAGIVLLRPRSFTVGLQAGSINYPMMHAIEGGFFERERLKPDVQVFNSANDALDAVLGGSVFIDSVIPIQNIATIQARQANSRLVHEPEARISAKITNLTLWRMRIRFDPMV